MTADTMFFQSKRAVMREILEDERDGGTSRTRMAILSGSLRFQTCDACGGKGRVPT